MTRLLCCADLHIGAGGAHRTDPLADQAEMLWQIVTVARDRKVDGVLIAGDVFHRPRPTPPELHVFARFCSDLRRRNIPSVAIHGNAGHDLVNGTELTALELFGDVTWMQILRVPEIVTVAGVTVGCLPSTPVHRLVAETGMSRDEANAAAADLLVKAAWRLRDDGATVLLAHWSVTGASLPNGLPVAELNEPVLPLEELVAQGWDAIVLGHIHKPQILYGPAAPVFYCGSPMCLDFGESNVDHGVWILNLDGEHHFPEFVELPGRRFVTVDVDLTGEVMPVTPDWRPRDRSGYVSDAAEQPVTPEHRGAVLASGAASLDETDQIVAAVTLPVTDAIVRVRVRASEEQWSRVDTAAINRFLADAGAHKWMVVPEITRTARARVEGIDESLSPVDAVSAWLAAQELDGPQRDGVLALLGTYLEAVA